MITITEVRNAQSLNDDNSRFDVEINHPEFGWIPYTLDKSDTDMTINNEDILRLIGPHFDYYVAPTDEELREQQENLIRGERNYLLATEVDPIVSNSLRWNDMSETKQSEWVQYRTDLLDLTNQASYPYTVVWPTKPE